MKFHNQRDFMGHKISNVTNKPLLHKKGKQWIVVAVSALILAGFGGVVSTTTHADTTNNGVKTESATSNSANNKPASAASTQQQANAMHHNLLLNASEQKPSNLTATNNNNDNLNNNSSKPAVHMMLTSSTPTITAQGKWGNANWNLDINNTLSITGNGLSMNTSSAPLSYNQQDSVKKIVVSGGVIAPVNANGLFGGNNSGVNHFNNVKVIDLSGLDTSNTTNMSNMFHGCGHLTNIYFKSPTNGSTLFNTKKVSDMNSMFNDDCRIKSLDMSVFDTENVHDYGDMFWNTPNLTSLDLSNFVMNTSLPNFNVSGMFDMANGDVAGEPAGDNGTWETNHTRQYQCLRSLTLNSSFSKINKNSACLNDAGIGTGGSSTTKNSDGEQNNFNIYNLNKQTSDNDWSSLANSNSALDKGIDHNSTQTYKVNFTDKTPNETTPSTLDSTTVTDEKNASTINISEITFPKNTLNGYTINYAALPMTGDTVPVKSDSYVDIPVFKESETLPSGKTIKLVSDSGTWGSSNWILYPNGNLILSGGQLTNPDVEAVSSNLMNDASKVKKILTYDDVSAPANDTNLFGYFPNVTDLNLSGLIDHENNSDSARDLFSNSVRKITLGSYVTLNGGLQAYPETSSPSHDTDIANNNKHSSNIPWIIDYAGTMSAEASADAQSAENAANTSASNTFTSASNWVSNNSNSAQSAASWVSNNSASESSASNSAGSAETWVNNNSYIISGLNTGNASANIQSAINSAVNSAEKSANSNFTSQSSYNELFSGSKSASTISSIASNVASSYANSLMASDTKNGTVSSVASAYANNAKNGYEKTTSEQADLNGLKNSKSGFISSVASSYANSIATSYASSAVNWVNNNGSTVSNEAKSASTSANTNAANINTNSANASNSAKNAEINAFGEAYVNNQVVAASVASSIANTVDSINTHIGSSYASAIASAQNLAGSAKTSAEAQAQTDAKSAFSSASSYANNLSSVASNSISASEKAMNTNMAKNSANASSSVASLSGSANTASASASKGISSNAKNISNNSNNINTNSNTASNGISNANASAAASASVASSNAQSVANQNSASASVSAFNANSNADSYALSLAQNATGVANANAGGIDNTMSYDDQTVQSLSNTVNANTISLANNDNDLYQSKENKPAAKKHGAKIAQLHQPLFYFYALKPLWLHTSAKFTKGNRAEELSAKHGYTLPITRIFKVNGALRFEVKIDGAKYFVTGNRYFARNAYIQPNEVKHNSSVKVLRAIREYKRAGFGKKNFIKGIRKGTVLPIKQAKTVANKQVTRLQLTNGHWITANKNLVKLI